MRIRIPAFLGMKLYLKYYNCKCHTKIKKLGMFTSKETPQFYWELGKIWRIPDGKE